MYVCVPCRETIHTDYEKCGRCGGPLVSSPYKWSPPRRNDKRAWKRIAKGEWLWDRRRVRRRNRMPNQLVAKLKGDGRYARFVGRQEYRQKPDVDLGA